MRESDLFEKYKTELKLTLMAAGSLLIGSGLLSFNYNSAPDFLSFCIRGVAIISFCLLVLNVSKSKSSIYYAHSIGLGLLVISSSLLVYASGQSGQSIILLCGVSVIGAYSLLHAPPKYGHLFIAMALLASFSFGFSFSTLTYIIMLAFAYHRAMTLSKIENENLRLEKETFQLESLLKYHSKMSHEILNPLTISVGHLEISIDELANFPKSNPIQERLKLCLLNHDRIETIIRDLNRGIELHE